MVEESVVKESHFHPPLLQFVIWPVDPHRSPSNHKPACPLFSLETGERNSEEEETERKQDMGRKKKDGLIPGEEREKRE